MPESVFQKYQARNYPYRYRVQLHMNSIAGGVPSDPKVAEGFLRTKLADHDELIRDAVNELMVTRGLSQDEAVGEVDRLRHLNGFRRDEKGLYIGGYQLKAALKEWTNISRAADKIGKKFGTTNKGIQGFVAEHIFVVDDRIHLGVFEPTEIVQRFVHTWRGTGIQYEEVVLDAEIEATIESDWEFSEEEWAALFITGERNGLGATRSQGYGTFTTVGWEQIPVPQAPRRRKAA